MYNSEDNYNRVKEIAEELDAIAAGKYYLDIDGNRTTDSADGENEPYTLFDYCAEVLDFEFIVGWNRDYRAVVITLCAGGPSVKLSTRTGLVTLAWVSDTASYPLQRRTIEMIDNIYENYFISDDWFCNYVANR